MRIFALAAIAICLASPAVAGDLAVTVRDSMGMPVEDAVVTVRPAAGVHGPIRFDWPYRVSQQDIQFHPFVLIVPVGTSVEFPNMDKVRHHVYSFSPAKPFQLKLYGREEKRTVQFDKAGVVALGCNIHDRMIGFIDVVDTPYAAKTIDTGRAEIPDIPAGTAVVTVWHPFGKAPGNAVSRQVTIQARGAELESITLDLRAGLAHAH